MRDYVWRTAGPALDVINISRPSSLYSSASYPMPERVRALSSDLELFGDERPRAGLTGVSLSDDSFGDSVR